MKRGPKHKPTAVHELQGTKRPDRHPNTEPKARGLPRPPKYLVGRALDIWHEVLPLCHWLRAADSRTLAAYCALEVEVENGVSNMVASRLAQYRMFLSELGMTPSARVRVQPSDLPPPPPKNDDDESTDEKERTDEQSLGTYLDQRPDRTIN